MHNGSEHTVRLYLRTLHPPAAWSTRVSKRLTRRSCFFSVGGTIGSAPISNDTHSRRLLDPLSHRSSPLRFTSVREACVRRFCQVGDLPATVPSVSAVLTIGSTDPPAGSARHLDQEPLKA